MIKYKRQITQKYEEVELIGKVNYQNTSVCVEIDGITMNDAELVGMELVNAMACQQYVIERGATVALWLEEFDYGRYDETSFESLLVEICEEFSIKLQLYN